MLLEKDVIKMLYFRFANIWGDRFTSKHTAELIEMWYEDWLDGLQGLDPNTFRDALKYCKENLEWSPSIAEFIRICDQALKIPNPRECMDAAIRGDFFHPIIKEITQQISSWDLRNGKEDDILRRFTELHKEEMINFRRKRSLGAQPPKLIEETSHGSEIARNNTRGNCVQKVEGYLF